MTDDARLAAIAQVATTGQATAPEVALLLESLGHGRKVVQRRAAEALAALHTGGRPMQARLLDLLRAPAPRQRWGAAYTLSLLGPPPVDCLPVLLETFGLDDGDLRWAAATIVVALGDQACASLRELVAGGNAPQRKMALYCLRDLDDRGAAGVVLAALGDGEATVRLAAMAALARLAVDRAAAARRLVELLADPDPGVCRAAAATLGRLATSDPAVVAGLLAAETRGDEALRRAAAAALVRIGAPDRAG